jgi:hypothetical protein
MTMALILAVPRRLAEGSQVLTRDKDWTGWSPTWMLGHRIWGKRLGIVGMGRIGQAVARRAKAFGLQIHYHNRRRVAPRIEEELNATYWESLDQMLVRMDIISVNCPHTPATYHLLSARRLKLMQPEAYIVNTARGEVIDENALARLIERAISPAPASTFSSTSLRSIPSSSSSRAPARWCCCRTSDRRPSKAASTWVKRLLSTSRRSWMATALLTAYFLQCCERSAAWASCLAIRAMTADATPRRADHGSHS